MITGNLHFSLPWEAYRLQHIQPRMAKLLIPEAGGVNEASPIKARVNHGRWVAVCECGGAEFAFNEGLFMCQSCWNAGHKHQYRRVDFPAKRDGIELILMARPLNKRNWQPGESLAQLEAENEEHKGELL